MQEAPLPYARARMAVLVAALLALGGLGGYAFFESRAGTAATADDDDAPAKKKGSGKKATKHARAYAPEDDPRLKIEDLPPRRFEIVNVHEHVLDMEHAKKLLEAMDALGVRRTCLMASSKYTFTLDNKYGFEEYKENNEELIRVKKAFPDRFCAFVTLDPENPDLALLQDYVARGADGLKLYNGHGAGTGKGPFHAMPLDDPRNMAIFAWAQEVQLPIVLHVNLIKYWDEFTRVMEAYPYLRVNIPHFGLHKNTQKRLDRLGFLLDRYPNLYTDISYGWHTFQIEGFETLSANRERTRRFFAEHADKILYASDMVLEPSKDREYLFGTLRSYMQHLEMERFRFMLVPDKTMVGLALPDDVLKKVYESAPRRFLNIDEKGMLPDRTKGWPKSLGEGAPVPGLPPTVPEVKTLAPGEMPQGEGSKKK